MEGIEKYIGVPFLEKGRNLEGWDCWGLVRFILFEHYGLELPSYDEFYDSTSNLKQISEKISEQRRKWEVVLAPQPGDVILIRMFGVGSHVAIVVGGGKMLHVEKNIDTVLENYRSPLWSKRILGFYRYVGTE